MKKLALAFLLTATSLAPAAIINLEFKFTPFTGNPTVDDHVTSVAGKAQVYLNNVPFGVEQEVKAEQVMVLFDDHEVSPAVWLPVSSAGSSVRKGKNTFRIEFTPNDTTKPYRAQLRWAAVTDQVASEAEGASGKETNQTGEGVDDRQNVQGRVVLEHEFTADFALDLPWHHYPAVTALNDEDKAKIVALLKKRADWFQPDFSGVYKAIEDNESLKADDVRRAHCLEEAYKAGVRVPAPAVADLEFATTGGPEVVVSRKGTSLFGLDEKSLAAVKDEQAQMCAGMVLATVYPQRMGFVRKPDGTWQAAD